MIVDPSHNCFVVDFDVIHEMQGTPLLQSLSVLYMDIYDSTNDAELDEGSLDFNDIEYF